MQNATKLKIKCNVLLFFKKLAVLRITARVANCNVFRNVSLIHGNYCLLAWVKCNKNNESVSKSRHISVQ